MPNYILTYIHPGTCKSNVLGAYTSDEKLERWKIIKMDRKLYQVISINNHYLSITTAPEEKDPSLPTIIDKCFIPCPRCGERKFTSSINTDLVCNNCDHIFRFTMINGNLRFTEPSTNPTMDCCYTCDYNNSNYYFTKRRS